MEALWCRGREASRVPTKFIIDHSLWTTAWHDHIIRSVSLRTPASCSSASYVDGYSDEFMNWGLSDEAIYGRGGNLRDVMGDSWTNEYEVIVRERMPRSEYERIIADATTPPIKATSTTSTKRKRQHLDEESHEEVQKDKELNVSSPNVGKKSKGKARESGGRAHYVNDPETAVSYPIRLDNLSDLPAVGAIQDIMFGDRVSVKWDGKRYTKSILKKEQWGEEESGSLPRQVPTISLPDSGHVNLTLRGHRFSSKGVEMLGSVLWYL